MNFPVKGANLISQKIGERVIIEKNDSSILVLEFYVELNSAKKKFLSVVTQTLFKNIRTS